MKISLSNLCPDPGQPRKLFDVGALEELAASIEQNGLMQAITVRKADKPGHFWIVAGERRYRAHLILTKRDPKFGHIEAVLAAPPTQVDLRCLQIVENDSRADLQPLERAQSYADLVALGVSVDEAAKRIGITPGRFQQRLSLTGLEPSISKLLASGSVDEAQAFEIARLPNHRDQTKILQMINRGEIGKWKSVKAAVDAILGGVTQADMFGAGAPRASAEDVKTVNEMEARIEKAAALMSAGWKDGACVVAAKVSPDRAAKMADRLSALRIAVRHMEQELRNVTAQARIALAE